MFKKYINKIFKNSVGQIAFFIPWFRATNETFVSYELYALQKKGITGSIFYERINKKDVQPLHERIGYPSHYIFAYPNRSLCGHRLIKLLSLLSLVFSNPVGLIYATVFFLRMPIVKSRSIYLLAAQIAVQLRFSKTSLIYIHDGAWMSFIGMLCSRFAGIPCGIIFHTEYVFARAQHLAFKITSSDFCIFQSIYSRNHALRIACMQKDAAKKMHVIYSPGVDTRFFTPIVEKKINKHTIHIISIGRLEEMKGYDRLIKAIGILVREEIQVDCVIVGYGSEKRNLTDLIGSLHLQKYIHMVGPLGHTKKLLRFMTKADMFVLPSIVDAHGDRDMQPNAVKEAMAMEVMVLTSNLGGIEEVIKDGENGFLLSSCEPDFIASSIKRIWGLSYKDKRIIQIRARETITVKHRLDMITDQLIDCFKREVLLKNTTQRFL